MKQFLESQLLGKKIVLLGYGREGASTYSLVRSYFPNLHLTIADNNVKVKSALALFNDAHLDIIVGDDYLNSALNFDVIIKSPGVSLKNHQDIYNSGKVTSQTDLFCQFYHKQIIGVTGTKGKSTVSSLIHHILTFANKHSILCGNIGIPVFDSIPQITSDSSIVVELSSHQLEFLEKAPHISILLNLFQEHLDHYTSLDAYHMAKANIFLKQQQGDFFIYHDDDSVIQQYLLAKPAVATLCPFSAAFLANDIISTSKLKGSHNALNCMAAVFAAKLKLIEEDTIKQAIDTFEALPHRMEYVGQVKGIHFYNDSISTIPEASIQSVLALKVVDTLILGGFDRGIDYSPLVDFVKDSEIGTLLFLGKAGERMMQCIHDNGMFNGRLILVESIQEAVNLAFTYTETNKICLLSPAAASYDQFKNFEERGEVYKKQIRSTI